MPHTSRHLNFYRIEAVDNYELGLRLGEIFGESVRKLIEAKAKSPDWSAQVKSAEQYLEITKQEFPHYIRELEGYAIAAQVDFSSLWTLSLEDEISNQEAERCTSMLTNQGKLFAHNEDWSSDSDDLICVIEKKIKDVTIFELSYFYTLGGNAVSINSHGYLQAINSLTHTDQQVGIPANIVARWLSETRDPLADYQKLCALQRGKGYSHTLVDLNGRAVNIECSSRAQSIVEVKTPFVHTNHYQQECMQSLEGNQNASGSWQRLQVAEAGLKSHMSADELAGLTDDQSCGAVHGLMNERTIGKLIFDADSNQARVWLRREKGAGWIDYKLEFLKSAVKRGP